MSEIEQHTLAGFPLVPLDNAALDRDRTGGEVRDFFPVRTVLLDQSEQLR